MLFTLFFVLSVLSALLCSGPIVNVLILLSRNFGLYIWLDLLFFGKVLCFDWMFASGVSHMRNIFRRVLITLLECFATLFALYI